MRRHGGQTLFYQHQLDLVGLHGRVRGLRLFEPRLRFEVFLRLLIHRQILSDANIKGVRCSALNFMAECGQTRRPETWVLIKEETPLLDIAQQAFEEVVVAGTYLNTRHGFGCRIQEAASWAMAYRDFQRRPASSLSCKFHRSLLAGLVCAASRSWTLRWLPRDRRRSRGGQSGDADEVC